MCPLRELVRTDTESPRGLDLGIGDLSVLQGTFFQVSCLLKPQLIKEMSQLGIHPPTMTMTFNYQKVTWYFQTYSDVMLEHVGPIDHL